MATHSENGFLQQVPWPDRNDDLRALRRLALLRVLLGEMLTIPTTDFVWDYATGYRVESAVVPDTGKTRVEWEDLSSLLTAVVESLAKRHGDLETGFHTLEMAFQNAFRQNSSHEYSPLQLCREAREFGGRSFVHYELQSIRCYLRKKGVTSEAFSKLVEDVDERLDRAAREVAWNES